MFLVFTGCNNLPATPKKVYTTIIFEVSDKKLQKKFPRLRNVLNLVATLQPVEILKREKLFLLKHLQLSDLCPSLRLSASTVTTLWMELTSKSYLTLNLVYWRQFFGNLMENAFMLAHALHEIRPRLLRTYLRKNMMKYADS